MMLVLMNKMNLISGGRRYFYGFIPTQDFLKKMLDTLCFGPVLGVVSEAYKEYVKSFLNGKSYQHGPEKLQTSILLVTGTTAVQAGLSDIIDIIYKKLQLVPEDFK
jgi:hypothetical protein